MSQAKKVTGTCKWFNSVKGYGFLAVDDGSEDVFVHQSEIHAEGFRNLAEGEKLEFEIVDQDNGKKKAIKVTGPNGDYVKGEAKPERDFNGNGRGGFNGGRGGGYRRGGRGGYGRGRGRGGYQSRGGGRGGYQSNNGYQSNRRQQYNQQR